jgi:hypothetical protein
MVGAEAALEIRVFIGTARGYARSRGRRGARPIRGAISAGRIGNATKLDPFRAYVSERLAAAAPERLSASVLLRELH